MKGGVEMKYSIEIGKIVEGALKHDQLKVTNYTKQLISKLEEDNEMRAASKFTKILAAQKEATLTAMGISGDFPVPVDSESRVALADVVYPTENNVDVILSKSNADKLSSFILSYQNADKLITIVWPTRMWKNQVCLFGCKTTESSTNNSSIG